MTRFTGDWDTDPTTDPDGLAVLLAVDASDPRRPPSASPAGRPAPWGPPLGMGLRAVMGGVVRANSSTFAREFSRAYEPQIYNAWAYQRIWLVPPAPVTAHCSPR